MAISAKQKATDILLIPVNLGNYYWVFLYISYPIDAAQDPTIFYFDPLGQLIPGDLLQAMRLAFHSPQLQVAPIGQRVQNDGYNCGPWIVVAAEMLITTGRVPEIREVNIQQEREKQQQLVCTLKISPSSQL